MPKWAQEKVEKTVNIFISQMEKDCRNSFQNPFNQNQLWESDQRNDYLGNVFQNIISWATSSLDEVMHKRSRRF